MFGKVRNTPMNAYIRIAFKTAINFSFFFLHYSSYCFMKEKHPDYWAMTGMRF